MDTYSHIIDGMQEDAMALLEKRLTGRLPVNFHNIYPEMGLINKI
jgi:hypothetical protein